MPTAKPAGHPAPEFEINPKRQFDIKTTSQTPKAAYEQFCREVEKAVAILGSFAVSDHAKTKKIQQLRERLHDSVRLPDWEYTTVNAPAVPAYQIRLGACRALATSKMVEIIKGIRHFYITSGVEAQALFNAIHHARATVAALKNEADNPSGDEEFFSEQDPEGDAAAIDAILKAPESPGTGEAPEEDAKCTNCGCDPLRERNVKDEPAEPAKAMLPSFPPNDVMARIRSLQGRVLTIVEAVIADKTQREAAKTLVNKEFRRELGKVNWLEMEEE